MLLIIEIENVENGFSVTVEYRKSGVKGFFSFPKNRTFVAENVESLKKLLEKIVDEFGSQLEAEK